MSVITIVGPKGGIGKTTLSINTTAALTRALGSRHSHNQICLVDLDLRLPTITSLLDSHPTKTFYDLFECLGNRTYQVDYLRTCYQLLTWFKAYIEGEIPARHDKLIEAFTHYKVMNTQLFQASDFKYSHAIQSMLLQRGEIKTISALKQLAPDLRSVDLKDFRRRVEEMDQTARPVVEEYINYIEEYGFSIIGGEVPILGKRGHRKRINEPEFLLLFLDFLAGVFKKFKYVVLDTPAGGVNHLSSLMNVIDQVLFVFDLSNTIAVNGSIDALHSFIDYYEEFQSDYAKGTLHGLDRAHVNRLVAQKGKSDLYESIKSKKMGIVFNRNQGKEEITGALKMLREYLDTLDKYHQYKNRIQIVGMIPNHKVINITNNRGTLFYNMDISLSDRMDQIAKGILSENGTCPSLGDGDKVILDYLNSFKKPQLIDKLGKIASNFS
ncbi:MAG: ParA family protein [Nitrospinaceae bacterium]|nr:ParA family protein [Nitrospinaceae bacterium]NIR54701.1 ParA family protein [Nitrospinaceae bacterium]NIS85122.1 ParA family protein [Nitrospinaceae bacterium]NIT81939.1 ParA family protein [Nitrospinaceae bacterium]NIU44200.1 ParA family protein [Nitrospinaceae bacterium]